MCNNGRCGHFDATGYWRFVMPAQQPQIRGVKLPPGAIFVDPDGQPFKGTCQNATGLHLYTAGMCYSKDEAGALLKGALHEVTTNRERKLLWHSVGFTSNLARREPAELVQAVIDFERPMLDLIPVKGTLDGNLLTVGKAVVVFLRGEPLTFGRDPMAGVALSMLDALQLPFRLRNEGKITTADEARLMQTLINDERFEPKLSIVVPAPTTDADDVEQGKRILRNKLAALLDG